MNCFKHLDELFPCGAERICGEVVSTSLYLVDGDDHVVTLSSKRKAWYVNASVNAWHMHRSLCADFREGLHHSGVHLTRSQRRLVHQGIRAFVCWAYEENYRTDNQYYSAYLQIRTGDWYQS